MSQSLRLHHCEGCWAWHQHRTLQQWDTKLYGMKQQAAVTGGRAARRLCAARAARQAAPARTAAPAGDKHAEALLIVEKVAKSHDGERMLFEGLTFTLARGERLSIVGENGAGKSTLLRILAGAARRPCTALQEPTARGT